MFPTSTFGQFYNPLVGAYNPSYNIPFPQYAGMRTPFEDPNQLGHTQLMQQFYHPRVPFYLPSEQLAFSPQGYQYPNPTVSINTAETISRVEISDPMSSLSGLAEIAARSTRWRLKLKVSFSTFKS